MEDTRSLTKASIPDWRTLAFRSATDQRLRGIAPGLFEKIGSVTDAVVGMELDALAGKYFSTVESKS